MPQISRHNRQKIKFVARRVHQDRLKHTSIYSPQVIFDLGRLSKGVDTKYQAQRCADESRKDEGTRFPSFKLYDPESTVMDDHNML